MRIVMSATILIFSGTTAYADWQFTQWGMTPREVMQITDAGIRKVSPKEEREKTNRFYGEAKLKSTYKAGAIETTAYYLFTEGKLSAVSLWLASTPDALKILATLSQQYGAAVAV